MPDCLAGGHHGRRIESLWRIPWLWLCMGPFSAKAHPGPRMADSTKKRGLMLLCYGPDCLGEEKRVKRKGQRWLGGKMPAVRVQSRSGSGAARAQGQRLGLATPVPAMTEGASHKICLSQPCHSLPRPGPTMEATVPVELPCVHHSPVGGGGWLGRVGGGKEWPGACLIVAFSSC